MPARNVTAAERKAARATVDKDIAQHGHFPKDHVDKAQPDVPPPAHIHENPPEAKLNGRWRDVDGASVQVADDGKDLVEEED